MKTTANINSIMLAAFTAMVALSSCSKQSREDLAPLRSMNGAGREAGIASEERMELERAWEPAPRVREYRHGIQALHHVGREQPGTGSPKPLPVPNATLPEERRLDSTLPIGSREHIGREQAGTRPAVSWVHDHVGQRPQILDGILPLIETADGRPEEPSDRSMQGGGRIRRSTGSTARIGR